MKKFILTFLLIALLCVLCACNNDAPSNNDTPSNTASCAELGHEMAYTSNSSVHVYKCTREGCTYAEAPKAHRGGIATCTAPGICTDCGMEYQKKTEHIFAGATCSKPGNCTVCNAEGGEQPPHTFAGATCIAQGSCTVCGTVGGELAYDTHVITSIGEPCTLCGEDYYNATLKFELMADGNSYAVTGIGSCEATELIIPAEHRGKPVVEIANEAFYAKNINNPITVTKVTIPDTIRSIGDGAFHSCRNLISVVIPDSVESIGDAAFAECDNLREVKLPSTLEIIENDVFALCTSLEAIELPSTLKHIGDSAFALTSIKAIELPHGIETIGTYAFQYIPIESIVIPDSVREMDRYALVDLTCLKSITIPGSVKNISEGLLLGCTELKEAVLEEGITRIEVTAFADCTSLERVSIPDSISFVGSRVFENCPSMQYEVIDGWRYLGNSKNPTLVLCKRINGTELITPDNTKVIMDDIARDVEEITSISIGASVCYIGISSFRGLDGVTNVEVSPENTTYYAKNKCIIERGTNKLLFVFRGSVIPDDGSVTSVNLSIFSQLETIESIVIPAGVKEVIVAMCDCGNLRTIVIGPDVERVTFGSNYDNGNYKVFVCNTKDKWKNDIMILPEEPDKPAIGPSISIGITNDFIEADHYFYSETEPTSYGKFWHYVNGVPTPW